MSTATIDQDTADRLSRAFHSCFSDFVADDGLFADDAFFDLLPPLWRFQLEAPATPSPLSWRLSPKARWTSRSFARSRRPPASSPSTSRRSTRRTAS